MGKPTGRSKSRFVLVSAHSNARRAVEATTMRRGQRQCPRRRWRWPASGSANLPATLRQASLRARKTTGPCRDRTCWRPNRRVERALRLDRRIEPRRRCTRTRQASETLAERNSRARLSVGDRTSFAACCLTFDMSGGPRGAKRPSERPLDGGVRRPALHVTTTSGERARPHQPRRAKAPEREEHPTTRADLLRSRGTQ